MVGSHLYFCFAGNTIDAAIVGRLFWTLIPLSTSYRFYAVIIAFSLNYAAYFAEIFRSGIQSIPVGQYEASHILGYNRMQMFLRIILPQVVKRILPAVTNETITLVKDTSLAFVIAYTELFTEVKQIAAAQTSMLPYLAAAIFYYVFNLLVAGIMALIENIRGRHCGRIFNHFPSAKAIW